MDGPDEIETIEIDDDEQEEAVQDGVVDYEDGSRITTPTEFSPRVTERSPETVMPSDMTPGPEPTHPEISQRSAPQLSTDLRETEGESSQQISGIKRKLPENQTPTSRKPKVSKLQATSSRNTDHSTMPPPPLPSKTPFRKAAYQGKKRTSDLLNFHQRGERAIFKDWEEKSVPPGTFCDCGKDGCKHCDRRRREHD